MWKKKWWKSCDIDGTRRKSFLCKYANKMCTVNSSYNAKINPIEIQKKIAACKSSILLCQYTALFKWLVIHKIMDCPLTQYHDEIKQKPNDTKQMKIRSHNKPLFNTNVRSSYSFFLTHNSFSAGTLASST